MHNVLLKKQCRFSKKYSSTFMTKTVSNKFVSLRDFQTFMNKWNENIKYFSEKNF